RQLFAYASGEGLAARVSNGPALLSAVDGERRWAVQDSADSGIPQSAVEVLTDGTRRLLGVFTTAETFKGPYHAAASALPDGGSVLVVTAFDAVLAAEVDAAKTVSLASAPVLRVRLVPLNRSEISAVTLLPREDATSYADGYLL